MLDSATNTIHTGTDFATWQDDADNGSVALYSNLPLSPLPVRICRVTHAPYPPRTDLRVWVRVTALHEADVLLPYVKDAFAFEIVAVDAPGWLPEDEPMTEHERGMATSFVRHDKWGHDRVRMAITSWMAERRAAQ